MAVTQETLDEIALSRAEYDLILERLDREPNSVELGMFGALWSEHCGYKHSRPLLSLFRQQSSRVLSQTGAENAGAVDIGDGLAVVFKVESHNHPSAVEPLQGAATGVGGTCFMVWWAASLGMATASGCPTWPLRSASTSHILRTPW